MFSLRMPPAFALAGGPNAPARSLNRPDRYWQHNLGVPHRSIARNHLSGISTGPFCWPFPLVLIMYVMLTNASKSRSEVRGPRSEIRGLRSEARGPGDPTCSDLRPRTSDLGLRTRLRTSGFGPRTSDLGIRLL